MGWERENTTNITVTEVSFDCVKLNSKESGTSEKGLSSGTMSGRRKSDSLGNKGTANLFTSNTLKCQDCLTI